MDDSRVQRAGVLARRWAALLGLALMLYVVLGSLAFSEWWYGFFYNDGYKSAGYIWNGLTLLKQNFLPLLILTILALCAAVAAGVRRRRQLFAVTDKFADLMILIAIVGIIATAEVLYRVPAVPSLTVLTRMASTSRTVRFGNGKVTVSPPTIEAPIYFRYLDTSRGDALYNQIEPELEEKERTVASSHGVKGKAEAGIDGSKIGVEAEKDTAAKSTFARSVFSHERKCVEVMKYVTDKWPDNYYSSADDWYTARSLKSLYNLTVQTEPNQVLVGREQVAPPSAEQEEKELKEELQRLNGLVIVEGDFTETTEGTNVILTDAFSIRPFSASFRVSLSGNAAKLLPEVKPLRLKVFGDVTHALGNDGFVHVNAIAVF